MVMCVVCGMNQSQPNHNPNKPIKKNERPARLLRTAVALHDAFSHSISQESALAAPRTLIVNPSPFSRDRAQCTEHYIFVPIIRSAGAVDVDVL